MLAASLFNGSGYVMVFVYAILVVSVLVMVLVMLSWYWLVVGMLCALLVCRFWSLVCH